jgi:hypothetical protein
MYFDQYSSDNLQSQGSIADHWFEILEYKNCILIDPQLNKHRSLQKGADMYEKFVQILMNIFSNIHSCCRSHSF